MTTAPQNSPADPALDPVLYVASLSGYVYAKSLADTTAPIVSLVTYPTRDHGDDEVKPDGGDWHNYNNGIPNIVLPDGRRFDPDYVNWTHRVPIGRGSVSHRTLKNGDQTATVAVGETMFVHSKADLDGLDLRRRNPKTNRCWDKEPPYTVDEILRVAAQAERLVRDDIATGTSVEFDVQQDKQGTDWWDIPGKFSVLDNRPARHFEQWRGLGWAHARTPVNPGCHTLAGQSDRTGAAIEKAIKIAQTGRLPGGEIVCKAIMDSFLDLKDYRSSNVSVQVEGNPPTESEVIVKANDSFHGFKHKATVGDETHYEHESGHRLSVHKSGKFALRTTGGKRYIGHGKESMHKLAEHIHTGKHSIATSTDQHGNHVMKSIIVEDDPNTIILKGDVQEGTEETSENTSKIGAGHQTAMDIAQGLMDLCQRAENNGSDDLSLRKFFKKLCGKLKDIAGDVKARAEKHKSKIDAHDKGEEGADADDTDPMDEDDYEPKAEEKAIELDDQGVIIVKSFDWKPRRMTFANLAPATPTVQPTTPDPVVVREDKATIKAKKALAKNISELNQLLTAAVANGKL